MVAATSHTSAARPKASLAASSSSSSAEDFNQADVTYAQGMSMHHQQAVEMSDILLEKDDVDADGRPPEE